MTVLLIQAGISGSGYVEVRQPGKLGIYNYMQRAELRGQCCRLSQTTSSPTIIPHNHLLVTLPPSIYLSLCYICSSFILIYIYKSRNC